MTPVPDAAALAALRAAGVDDREAERLAAYAALVLDANRRVNLTGAAGGEAFAEHILDALTLRDLVIGPLIDVGSGNGLPGIVLALVTGCPVTLLEPIAKRAAFLTDAVEALALEATVLVERAESAAHRPQFREGFGSATARAVGGAPTVAELTVPFLVAGGVALLQRGGMDERERAALAGAARMLGAEVSEERPAGGERRILVLRKSGPTPPGFPRRNGVPAKRPLCT